MPELRPWSEVAKPHRDIAAGTFDESQFAADLGSVARGDGPQDYVDPHIFCEKTYLTNPLADVLVELAGRLNGDRDASSVYRLQTEFGGGKTHTLLAVYHLFRNPSAVADTPLAKELQERIGGELPKAEIVVLDGSHLRPNGQEMPDGTEVNTLLGHLAWRLGGSEAFGQVAEQDRDRIGSSTEQLADLLAAHAPCIVLLDELLEYLNKVLSVRTHDGNLAATTLTVVKELVTAAAQTPRTAVVATLTSSRMEDYSTVAGEEMQQRLSGVVGRSESIVTPVEGDDIFPILHRRLFDDIGDADYRSRVADAYGDWYDQMGDVIPSTFREASYRQRMVAAYPFHPELIDICTNRWGSLSGFQRTRGALRILAHTVKALSQRDHPAPLIHSGDLPLDDPKVRSEVLNFAGDSYKSALNADIIREDSRAPQEDRRRGGHVEAMRLATGLATTAFVNSHSADRVLGASAAQMLLGVGQPGLSRGLIEDVRDTLAGSLWYMRFEGGRYRFTTEPNLNKVIVEREAAVHERDLASLLDQAVRQKAPSVGELRVVHRVSDSTDLPDDGQLTLGVVDQSISIGDEDDPSLEQLRQILTTRGNAHRTHLNAVVLVAPDATALQKARREARTLAAMQDLEEDEHRLKRFNTEQRQQLSDRIRQSQQRLPHQLAMAFRHVLLLRSANGGVELEHVDLGPAGADSTITQRVVEYLTGADRLVLETLAPAALLSDRFTLLPAEKDAIELDELLRSFTRFVHLPKLGSDDVLRRCLADGVERGIFGLTSGSSWNATDAVIRFDESVDPTEIHFQPGTWLVRASAVRELIADLEPGDRDTGTDEPGRYEPQPPKEPRESPGEPGGADRGTGARRVTIRVRGVDAEKVRDLVRTAVLPLRAHSSSVRMDMTVRAEAAGDEIPRDTLDLVIAEGLRQLGIADVDFDIER